jgi:hypothetical protein
MKQSVSRMNRKERERKQSRSLTADESDISIRDNEP